MIIPNKKRIRDMLAAALVMKLPKYRFNSGCLKDNQTTSGAVAEADAAVANLYSKDTKNGHFGLRIEVGLDGLNLYYTHSWGTFDYERWIYAADFDFDNLESSEFLANSFGKAADIKLIKRQIKACDALAWDAFKVASDKWGADAVARSTPISEAA